MKRPTVEARRGHAPIEVEQKLITNKEFCQRLGMSEPWGRKMLQNRQINYVKIGRRVRIPESELQKFIVQNTVPARID